MTVALDNFRAVMEHPTAKGICGGLGAIAGAMVHHAPNAAAFAILLAALLWLTDLLLGWRRAVVEGKFERRKFGRSITKLVVYGAYVIVGAGIGMHAELMTTDEGYQTYGAILTGITSLLVATEALSIREHCEALGYPLPLKPLWRLVDKLTG